MSPSEKVFQGPKVVVNRFGRYLAQKLSVMRYFKCHPGSLFRLFVLEFGGGFPFVAYGAPKIHPIGGILKSL